MENSEYENIEIFNKTQSFGINKYENQVIRCHDTMGKTCEVHHEKSKKGRAGNKPNNRIFGIEQGVMCIPF